MNKGIVIAVALTLGLSACNHGSSASSAGKVALRFWNNFDRQNFKLAEADCVGNALTTVQHIEKMNTPQFEMMAEATGNATGLANIYKALAKASTYTYSVAKVHVNSKSGYVILTAETPKGTDSEKFMMLKVNHAWKVSGTP